MFGYKFDPWALLFLLLAAGIYFLIQRRFKMEVEEPTLTFSSITPFKGRRKTLRERYAFIPNFLSKLSLLFFGLAFLDPHILQNQEGRGDTPPQKGLAIYLVLDRSGSMGKVVDQRYEDGMWQMVTRLDVMKTAAKELIATLPSDLIGVLTFARAAEVLSPLTLDHKVLIEKINGLTIIKDKEQDGTSMGYALYKTAHLIAGLKSFQESEKGNGNPPYKIQKPLMMIITDGFQDPNLLDKGNRLRSMELEVAAAYAKEQGIKVFIVNVDPETLNNKKYLPNRNELQRAASVTGGSLIVVNKIDDLTQLIENIPKAEMSEIYPHGRQVLSRTFSFYPYLIAAGLLLMGLALGFNDTVWRKSL